MSKKTAAQLQREIDNYVAQEKKREAATRQAHIDREAERARKAPKRVSLSEIKPSRWSDAEPAVRVISTIGDLGDSHGAAYRALKDAGVEMFNLRAGQIDIDPGPSLPRTMDRVARILRDAGINVHINNW